MAKHPFVPEDLDLPGYAPITMSVEKILVVSFSSFFLVGLLSYKLSGGKNLALSEKIIMVWFGICGFTHLMLEGNFVADKDFFKNDKNSFFPELWKEYSKADSRYAARDPFIVLVEGITAFLFGPLCVALVFAIRHQLSWRFPLMIVVSMGQLYGTVLYFGIAYMTGFKDTRPEPLYFWFYFIGMNGLWLIFPTFVIGHAWSGICTHCRRGNAKKVA